MEPDVNFQHVGFVGIQDKVVTSDCSCQEVVTTDFLKTGVPNASSRFSHSDSG
jgi:hypothetical protein